MENREVFRNTGAFKPYANHLSPHGGMSHLLHHVWEVNYFYILLNIYVVEDPALGSQTTEMDKEESFSREPHSPGGETHTQWDTCSLGLKD